LFQKIKQLVVAGSQINSSLSHFYDESHEKPFILNERKGVLFMKFAYKLFFNIVLLVIIINTDFIMADLEKSDLSVSNSAINIYSSKIESCSKWAVDEVNESKNIGIIPDELCSNYTNPITRGDFCKLIINTLMIQNNKIITSTDNNIKKVHYSDTNDVAVKQATVLGIVSGIGNNRFNPNGNITRQEAARMLYMAATISERNTEFSKYFNYMFHEDNKFIDFPNKFADIDEIDYWGSIGIQYCFQNNIMLGIGNNKFNPSGTYSREQAYITALRLYKRFNGEGIESDIVKDDKTDLYGYNSSSLSLPCKYEKAYKFKNGKAIVCENSIYKLINTDENVLIDNISSNIKMLSDKNNYIFDCYGDYIMVMTAKYSKLESDKISYYYMSLYKADGKLLWEIEPKIRFTKNGDIIYYDEQCTSEVTNKTVAVFRLYNENNDFELVDSMYIYKK